jgi:hypothetical protein
MGQENVKKSSDSRQEKTAGLRTERISVLRTDKPAAKNSWRVLLILEVLITRSVPAPPGHPQRMMVTYER